MKTIACLLALIACTSLAHADEPLSLLQPARAPAPAPAPARAPVQNALSRARRLKLVGINLTVIDIAAAVAGSAVLLASERANANLGDRVGYEAIGVLLLGTTAAIAAIGVPLWAVGASRESALLKLHPELVVAADGNGGMARLTLHF